MKKCHKIALLIGLITSVAAIVATVTTVCLLHQKKKKEDEEPRDGGRRRGRHGRFKMCCGKLFL